jgi:PDZ domain-containing protein
MSFDPTASWPPPQRPDTVVLEGGPEVPRRRRRWRIVLSLLVALLAVAVVATLVRIPYYVISPGPARDVQSLIHIDDRTVYPSDGRLLLTAVNLRHASVYDAFEAWIDPAKSVIPEREVLAPGETREEQGERARSEMDTSKIDAAVVALTEYVGYPENHGRGVLVETVLVGAPADGKLFAGDVILSVDGELVDDPADLSDRIRAVGEGTALTFRVEAGGEIHEIDIAPARVPDVSYPVIGIASVHNFPFPLTIDSADIGGPSAGLMWTLGLAELLTPGDLTDGRVIAGTGVISPDGQVGPIGGVEEKVVAAERAGATIFFVPADNASSARAVADEIVIVAVDTYAEAIDYLEDHP